jgi:hypothetical protein
MQSFSDRAKKLNSELIYENLEHHKGGYGYECLNTAIKLARGKFLIFAANDDYIFPNHFENYLSEIRNTADTVGIVAFCASVQSSVTPYYTFRKPCPLIGAIGHSECIFRTEYVKAAPPHEPLYGHDWSLIKNIIEEQNKEIIILWDNEPTYQVRMR